MARPGVSYQDIANAANELKGQGKNVTIENVRALLGTGSIGTINQHLRQWKEIQYSTQRLIPKDNLPDSLIALMKGLWEDMMRQSSAQLIPIEEKHKQEIIELNRELEKYKKNNQRWQKLFNQWQQAKITLMNEKLTLEQALEFSLKENQSLRGKYEGVLQQLQEKQERVEELHRLHQQTQANLEHYRNSAREQRLLDQQQFEQEKQQFLVETKDLKEKLIVQQINQSEFHQQNQLLERSFVELETKHSQSLLVIESLKNEIHQLEKNTIEHQQTRQHWQTQFSDLQKSFEVKMTEIISLQADNKLLNQQLLDTKERLRTAKDQNKLLASEKWEVAQEKAQLEGQLKQMQKEFS